MPSPSPSPSGRGNEGCMGDDLLSKLNLSHRKFHFPDPGSPRRVKIKEVVEGGPMKADAGWTGRVKRATTAAPQPDQHPNSVRRDGGRTLARLERLQADLCRSLGGVSTRPSTLPDLLLQWSGGQDAGVWQPGADGLCRIPLLAVWPGHPSGGDELQIVVVLAVCQSLRR